MSLSSVREVIPKVSLSQSVAALSDSSKVLQAGEKHDIESIYYDPWQSTKLATELTDHGARLIPFRQTVTNFNEPIRMIEELREMQHSTMIDLCADAVVKDERLTLAATGELRAYSQIIGLYDDFVQQQMQQAEIDAEQRAG